MMTRENSNAMPIISASRRTDIPAFFPQWFIERVREGFFYRLNPFNANQVKSFSLKPDDVDAIVFWTKNPKPLLQFLPELNERGLNYYFHYTLNPYGKPLEPNVPTQEERIETFQKLAEMIGPKRVIWRYDPIILSSITPAEYHIEQFSQIASRLKGATSQVMFSFLDFYAKTTHRLKSIEQQQRITFHDITQETFTRQRHQLLSAMQLTAKAAEMTLYSCAEAEDLEILGIHHGHCIDGQLIQELFNSGSSHKKDKHQREGCGCVASVDMGSYNSCSFHCAYCYANASQNIITKNLEKHNRKSAAIVG
jgi:DNA repair photolyase